MATLTEENIIEQGWSIYLDGFRQSIAELRKQSFSYDYGVIPILDELDKSINCVLNRDSLGRLEEFLSILPQDIRQTINPKFMALSSKLKPAIENFLELGDYLIPREFLPEDGAAVFNMAYYSLGNKFPFSKFLTDNGIFMLQLDRFQSGIQTFNSPNGSINLLATLYDRRKPSISLFETIQNLKTIESPATGLVHQLTDNIISEFPELPDLFNAMSLYPGLADTYKMIMLNSNILHALRDETIQEFGEKNGIDRDRLNKYIRKTLPLFDTLEALSEGEALFELPAVISKLPQLNKDTRSLAVYRALAYAQSIKKIFGNIRNTYRYVGIGLGAWIDGDEKKRQEILGNKKLIFSINQNYFGGYDPTTFVLASHGIPLSLGPQGLQYEFPEPAVETAKSLNISLNSILFFDHPRYIDVKNSDLLIREFPLVLLAKDYHTWNTSLNQLEQNPEELDIVADRQAVIQHHPTPKEVLEKIAPGLIEHTKREFLDYFRGEWELREDEQVYLNQNPVVESDFRFHHSERITRSTALEMITNGTFSPGLIAHYIDLCIGIAFTRFRIYSGEFGLTSGEKELSLNDRKEGLEELQINESELVQSDSNKSDTMLGLALLQLYKSVIAKPMDVPFLIRKAKQYFRQIDLNEYFQPSDTKEVGVLMPKDFTNYEILIKPHQGHNGYDSIVKLEKEILWFLSNFAHRHIGKQASLDEYKRLLAWSPEPVIAGLQDNDGKVLIFQHYMPYTVKTLIEGILNDNKNAVKFNQSRRDLYDFKMTQMSLFLDSQIRMQGHNPAEVQFNDETLREVLTSTGNQGFFYLEHTEFGKMLGQDQKLVFYFDVFPAIDWVIHKMGKMQSFIDSGSKVAKIPIFDPDGTKSEAIFEMIDYAKMLDKRVKGGEIEGERYGSPRIGENKFYNEFRDAFVEFASMLDILGPKQGKGGLQNIMKLDMDSTDILAYGYNIDAGHTYLGNPMLMVTRLCTDMALRKFVKPEEGDEYYKNVMTHQVLGYTLTQYFIDKYTSAFEVTEEQVAVNLRLASIVTSIFEMGSNYSRAMELVSGETSKLKLKDNQNDVANYLGQSLYYMEQALDSLGHMINGIQNKNTQEGKDLVNHFGTAMLHKSIRLYKSMVGYLNESPVYLQTIFSGQNYYSEQFLNRIFDDHNLVINDN